MMIAEVARAKINLTLEVLGRRADGYHELASLVAFADFGDIVTLDTARPPGVTVDGPFAPSIASENLVAVTLRRLAAADERLTLGHVHLEKRLPVTAGIGGGSADAAAVLRAVRRANPEHENEIDWLGLAANLGADVPACFASITTWMTGVGEQLSPLSDWPRLDCVLVNPLEPAPLDKTAQVYKRLAASPLPDRFARPAPPRDEGPVAFLLARGNRLEAAAIALMPSAAEVKAALSGLRGCRYAAVSGGGPTCFGVFEDASPAAETLKISHPGWWVQGVVLG